MGVQGVVVGRDRCLYMRIVRGVFFLKSVRRFDLMSYDSPGPSPPLLKFGSPRNNELHKWPSYLPNL